MNATIERGYRFTPLRDSADIVLALLVKPHSAHDERLPAGYPNDSKAPAKGLPSVSEFKFGTSDSLPRLDRIESNSKGDGSSVSVWVFGYDGKTGRPLISIFGFGSYSTSSLSIAAHYLIRSALDQLEFASPDNRLNHFGSGMVGISYVMFSADGFNYWPTITSLVPDAPANNIGLRVNDEILKVDDVPLKNASHVTVLDIIKGDSGTARKMTVWRKGEGIKDVSIHLGKRPPGK